MRQQKVFNTQLDMTSTQLFQKNNPLLELQGQCKIHSIRGIKIHWVKAILIIIPIIVSLIGLLLLKYYKWFRVKVFYTDASWQEATAVYIEAADHVQDIQWIQSNPENKDRIFFFKKLKYRILNSKAVPFGFNCQSNYVTYVNQKHLEKGMDTLSIHHSRQQYGLNQHLVDTPLYPQYMFDVMTKPFFLLQYIICIIFILENIWIFAVVMLAFALITTSINYILLWISFGKIKEIAQKVIKVSVLREGKIIQIDSVQLVPGDIFIPHQEIVCDGVLLQGEVYVNQASLTGQSVPIGKFPLINKQSLKQSSRWLYEGSRVLECRPNSLAMVVNVGYATRRGRIIRKILTRVPKQPDFFNTAMLFLIETFLVGLVLYLATLPILLNFKIIPVFIGYRFLDFLGWAFPPPFPIYFNLTYSFSLGRLRHKNIIGTQPQKTVDSARLKTMCFDKTGTLTQNTVQVYQIFKFNKQLKHQDITKQKKNIQNLFIWKLFATCHTVKQINGQFLGDQVDLRMFLFTDFQMRIPTDSSIKFQVQDSNKNKLQVLRINQFQSKFQSMSVLVRDCSDGKLYGFIKGAPQKIQKNSIVKYPQYQHIVSSLSLGGYRTIGFGYKQIQQTDLEKYLTGPRQAFDDHITALGLVGFQNKLKHDTRQTILSLIEAGIEPKMITGDNIYIAVQTGVRAGIINAQTQVILLEGRKQNFIQGQERVFKGILVTRTQAQTTQQPITLKQQSQYLTQTRPIAIDNDFLTMNPQPVLTDKIKLFSRISPENKALVVKRFKQKISHEYQKRSFFSRFFGSIKPKVGMTGDGANDLMAIRQADVGLGISQSDASYGASFTINNMMDIDEIVRQSKCCQQNIIQIFQYYGTISFIKIPASILLVSDATYFNGLQLIYFNFTSTLFFPTVIALSTPSKTMNKYSPCSNFMGLQNHLLYWGNTIIPTIGMIAGYFYFKSTQDFQPNTKTTVTVAGYFPVTDSTSIVWLMIQIPFCVNAYFLYFSKPWKQKIWNNWPLMFLLLANIIVDIVLFFITPNLLAPLFVLKIAYKEAGIVLLIMFGSVLLGWGFNLFVEWLELYKRDDNLKSDFDEI